MKEIKTCLCPWEYISNRCPVHCVSIDPKPEKKEGD